MILSSMRSIAWDYQEDNQWQTYTLKNWVKAATAALFVLFLAGIMIDSAPTFITWVGALFVAILLIGTTRVTISVLIIRNKLNGKGILYRGGWRGLITSAPYSVSIEK
jgi:hypothetical protein